MPDATDRTSGSTAAPTRIVFLDDSEIALEAVKDGLAPLGFEVTTHRNPLTIHQVLASALPELLLLDAQMPTVNGKIICSEIRQRTRDLAIVLFSSLDAAKLSALVAECGADGYIVKSGDYPAIAAELRRLLRARAGGSGVL